jgi:hypothetical protein
LLSPDFSKPDALAVKAFHPGIIDVPDCKAWNG